MIPYGRQNIDYADIEAVTAILGSNWLTQGPAIEAFEEAVAESVEAKFAVAFSSGTAALHAAAVVAGLGSGQTGVSTPLTFMASINAIRYVGATPGLVDIDEATFNIDLNQVPAGVDAVIPVHYAGLPVELENPGWLEKPRIVIEDAAHALGARSVGGPVGNCASSDMTCFSFHPVKPITSGEGGMVTTNSAEYYEGLKRFRSHGIVRMPERGRWYYEISDIGMNYRLTDIQAALGLSQISKLNKFIEARNEIAMRYSNGLADVDELSLPPVAPPGSVHGYHLFPIRAKHRDSLFEYLFENGIQAQVHYVPVHHHPISADIELPKGGMPVADRVYSELLSLPVFPNLSQDSQNKVISTIKAFYAKSSK